MNKKQDEGQGSESPRALTKPKSTLIKLNKMRVL